MNLSSADKKSILEALELALDELHNRTATCPDVTYHAEELKGIAKERETIKALKGRIKQSLNMSKGKKKKPANPDNISSEPDWSSTCDNCGASPIVPVTGLCGPCTFGEAETAGGNW